MDADVEGCYPSEYDEVMVDGKEVCGFLRSEFIEVLPKITADYRKHVYGSRCYEVETDRLVRWMWAANKYDIEQKYPGSKIVALHHIQRDDPGIDEVIKP